MANGLAAAGLLTTADTAWHRQANDRANALYPDPAIEAPDCYTLSGSCAWFKTSATQLLDMCQEYLTLLDKYAIPWVELRSRQPGTIVYEDQVQVVVQPFGSPEHWDELWKQRAVRILPDA